MRIDSGSLAFNININGKVGGTPSWGTAIVYQTFDNKIKEDIAKDILIGMIYKKIDCTSHELSLPLGKGGHIYYGDEDFTTNGAPAIPYLAAKFEKTYVNGVFIGKPFILLVMKDGYEAHFGRLQLKYSPKISWGDYTNQDFFNETFKRLGISPDAPLVYYDIEVCNQDTLNFKCVYKEEEYKFNDKSEYNAFVNKAIQDDKFDELLLKQESIIEFPFQTIFYGAPGTGKSNKIEECTNDNNRIRTTFHPDSDYSTFVGAYKPTMEGYDDKIYSKGELINKLTEFKNSGVPYSVHKFAAKYWRSLKNLNILDKKEILASCAISDSYTVELDKSIAIGEEYLKQSKESHISYQYVPQAFLKAYVNSWSLIDKLDNSPYYLIIEEINRGNCAQIFGDLFQLLDRGENGESKYAICPDEDIRRYLAEQFNNATNIPDAIKNGKEMRLPSNLYIWATMNTSDQSLFPIDSAFKRRWDWEYIPIEKGNKNFVIEIGNKKYDWWNFISIINGKIDEITGSEDKKLGYWFAKPAGNSTTIKCDQFVSKVLFYLWNDVYKDYTDDNRSIFRIVDGNSSKKVTFTEFFGAGREEKLYSFMQANGINPISNSLEGNNDENLNNIFTS